MTNMKKVDMARSHSQTAGQHMSASESLENYPTERFVIELESEGTDFHTVFKNQQVAVDKSGDLIIRSIVDNLAIRGFVLREQVISYFSQKSKCFVAAAKRPIPIDAIIPASDTEKNGRLTLKIWPQEKLPESLLLELDCRPKPKLEKDLLSVIGNGGASGVAQIEATLRSSCSNID